MIAEPSLGQTRSILRTGRTPDMALYARWSEGDMLSFRCYSYHKPTIHPLQAGESDQTQHFRPRFVIFYTQTARNSQTFCTFATVITL